jgi:hypothetical protein
MKELTDMAKADSKNLSRVHVKRWRLFLLLPLLLVAHGCGGGGAGETDPPTSTPPATTSAPAPTSAPATSTALPNDLVGQWKTTLGYIPAYYTGLVPLSTTDFIGSIAITVSFHSNGAYRFDLSTASRYFGGNCFRTTQWNESGGASVAGADLTFTSTHASNIITDSCGKFQFIDPAPTGTATYAMTLAQDQTGWPILRLRIAGGDDLVLEKCRHCR